ncbi:MAG: hypothetical protein M3459_01260 [Actinomycetota bacterium]|nr:hypothetical protein [Actinomycetota bacterium]
MRPGRTAALLAAVAGLGVGGGCGEEEQAAPPPPDVLEEPLLRTEVDQETGLVFQVRTPTLTGRETTLAVAFSERTPAGVRTQLANVEVAASCELPGVPLQFQPGPWNLSEPFITPLVPERPINVAQFVTTCMLVIGEPAEEQRGFTEFSEDPEDALAVVEFR